MPYHYIVTNDNGLIGDGIQATYDECIETLVRGVSSRNESANMVIEVNGNEYHLSATPWKQNRQFVECWDWFFESCTTYTVGSRSLGEAVEARNVRLFNDWETLRAKELRTESEGEPATLN